MTNKTTDMARETFKGLDLTYDVIKKEDLLLLSEILSKHLKKHLLFPMRMSKIIKSEFDRKGLIRASLTVNGSYFKRREAITFNGDGFIGFAGWSGGNNIQPILNGFIEWCNILHKRGD